MVWAISPAQRPCSISSGLGVPGYKLVPGYTNTLALFGRGGIDNGVLFGCVVAALTLYLCRLYLCLYRLTYTYAGTNYATNTWGTGGNIAVRIGNSMLSIAPGEVWSLHFAPLNADLVIVSKSEGFSPPNPPRGIRID